MYDIRVTEPLREFIAKYIDSVETLDILLFLHDNRTREWGAAEVSRELRSNPASVAKRLADLCLRGLCTLRVTPDLHYRYAPHDPQVEKVLDELSDRYYDHRATIIKLIFSKPLDKVSVFSDAFLLGKEKEDL